MKRAVGPARRARTSRDASVYVYGVAPAGRLPVPGATGLGDQPVRWVEAAGLAALVSAHGEPTAAPRRQNLAAHERTLAAALAGTSVLPFSFGTVASSEARVQALLEQQREALNGALARVGTAREHRVTVSWAAGDLFAYVVSRSRELRELRDLAFRGGRRPDREAMIEIGACFEAARNAARAADAATVRETLQRHCVEVCDLGARGEACAVDLACLVERGDAAVFDAAVSRLTARLDDHHHVSVAGPFPPYDFVDLRLSFQRD